MSLVAVGVLILSAPSIVCFAAYKTRAKSFEVSMSVWKIASFSIKIISADAGNRESPAAAQRRSRAGARDIDIFGDPLLVAVSCSVRTGCLWITP